MKYAVKIGSPFQFYKKQCKEQQVVGKCRDSEISKHTNYLLRAGAELWRAVIREGQTPAEDTRVALEAIRASLDAARRLRFAGDVMEDERHRLMVFAAEAAEVQEAALWLWYVGRGFDTGGRRTDPYTDTYSIK